MYEEHKGWFYRLHMLSTQAHRRLNKEEEKHDPNKLYRGIRVVRTPVNAPSECRCKHQTSSISKWK